MLHHDRRLVLRNIFFLALLLMIFNPSILLISLVVIHKNGSLAILLPSVLHLINLLILFKNSHLELSKLYFWSIILFGHQDVRGLVSLAEHLGVWLI